MEKETKSKKGKIIAIIVVTLILLAVVGYFAVIKIQQNQVKNKVNEMFENLTNSKGQEEYFGEMLDNYDNSEYYHTLFRKLNYNIKSVKGSSKNVTVNIEVSNKNMAQVLKNYFAKAVELSFTTAFSSSDNNTEEFEKKLNEYLIEQVESEEIETITSNINLELVKDNGEWILTEESQSEIINAALPGFKDFEQSLENINN